jgi:hypothetical protein
MAWDPESLYEAIKPLISLISYPSVGSAICLFIRGAGVPLARTVRPSTSFRPTMRVSLSPTSCVVGGRGQAGLAEEHFFQSPGFCTWAVRTASRMIGSASAAGRSRPRPLQGGPLSTFPVFEVSRAERHAGASGRADGGGPSAAGTGGGPRRGDQRGGSARARRRTAQLHPDGQPAEAAVMISIE